MQIQQRVVTVGGGTGSFTMLTELKKVIAQGSLWSIVTMADSGGSSRKLMDEFGKPLPLGDLRQALVALSRRSKLWGDLFSYRFPPGDNGNGGESGMSGHSLGNLILLALEELNNGDLMAALEDAEDLLNTAGRVLPVTLDKTTLCATLADGTVLRSESTIDQAHSRHVAPITDVYLDPSVAATRSVLKALERADRILIGPGDLYTSIVPCLLVEGVAETIRIGDAEIVYICNIMTKYGETDGYAASDFVEQIHRYLGHRIDTVVVNSFDTDHTHDRQLETYRTAGVTPVAVDLERLQGLVPNVIVGPFSSAGRLIRHDAELVIRALWPTVGFGK